MPEEYADSDEGRSDCMFARSCPYEYNATSKTHA